MRINLKRNALATSALVTATLVAADAMAEPVLIDFGTADSFRGASPSSPDSNGNYWNVFKPGDFLVDLVDSGNNATTIDIGLDGSGGLIATDSFNGPAGNTTTNGPGDSVYNAAALGDFGIDEVVYDYIVADGDNAGDPGPGRFQIQGLDSNSLYRLTFFGSHKFNSDNTTVYEVFSDSGYSSSLGNTSLVVGVGSAHNQDTVTVIDNISPTGSIFYVEFGTPNGDEEGYLNALSIEVVPEPSSLALLGLGGLLIARRRR